MSKIRATPVVLMSFFLYMFCSVLCFAVEDIFLVKSLVIALFTKSYWFSFSCMLVFSISILIHEIITRNEEVFDNESKNSPILNFCTTSVVLFVIFNASNMLHKLFTQVKAGTPEILIIFIDIFAVSAYALWLKLINSNIKQKSFKKYLFIICASITLMDITVFCLANKFESRKLISYLRTDNDTYKSVRSISSVLQNTKTVYNNTDELIKHVKKTDVSKLKDNKIQYKKINDTEFELSWEYTTPENEYSRIRKLNRSGSFLDLFNAEWKNYKSGKNTRIYKIK